MARGVRLLPETLRSLAFGSISGTYAGLGTALTHPAAFVKIDNTTDVALTFSFDGVNDHFVIQSGQSYEINASQNKATVNGLFISDTTRFYVKQTSGAAGSGAAYLASFYIEGM